MLNETPEEFQKLLAEAERLYEDNDFAGAVRTFRAAALLAPLTNSGLDCLVYAQREEAIDFRRQIARASPDSIDSALAEIEALAEAGHRRQAIARCSEWLERPGLTEQEIHRVRSTRLQAATRVTEPTNFAADFTYLWEMANLNSERIRLTLLRTLITLDQPQVIDALVAIRDHLGADGDLNQIIASKIEQLTALARLKAALPPIRRREAQGDQL